VHAENSDEVKRAKDIFERAGARTTSRIPKEKNVPKQEERRAETALVAGPRAEERTRNFFRRNYEDHRKRDGRNGLDPAMGDRHSRADITRAVHGARLHIIRNSCALISDP
jgi:hypothetical protein